MRLLLSSLALLAAFQLAGCASTGYRADAEVGLRPVSAGVGSVSGDLAGRPGVESLIDRLVASGDYDRGTLVAILSRVESQPWIIELMDRQATPSRATGPTGAWTRYRARFVTSESIANGVAFWRRHETALERAEARYGVPPEYVVAILGVETRYGGYLGTTRILDALATLAFDYPRRAEYFTRELESFLVMCRHEGIDPLAPRGSYAGAMGLGQFMPTSFHGYAVDFDGDGHRDLWGASDAIGSVANYLSGHGWRRGEPVAVPARAMGFTPKSLEAGFAARYPVSLLVSRGITAVNPLLGYREASLLELDATDRYEYWLGLDNFQVITSYNRSTYYAMAVHQLAQELRRAKGEGPILTRLGQEGSARGLAMAVD
ncbi:lytic murein transglycosylase B [Thiococcus pfennigii]|uniref:lytic murein transglycosylase B n=1 Tax=Thiococcus pfennigii TaxID=1057 RepID=UPI0019074243|nr:lytic murein transglycosylase B [Thiococcus pfennigii]MBK1733483.1 lytic murein transglycosylase B [Thiococcus pfennigii]